MSEISLILADDVAPARRAIAELLALEPDIAVLGDFGDGTSALAALHALRPDVALVAADLPGLAATELATRAVDTNILVLASITAQHVATGPGIAGYLARTAPWYRIAEAVRTAASGGTFLDPDLTFDDDHTTTLTTRERSVLSVLPGSGSIREIAELVGMSLEAVGLTMNSLLAKTGGRNRLEATQIATARGWI